MEKETPSGRLPGLSGWEPIKASGSRDQYSVIT